MECYKKGGFIKVGLNIIIEEMCCELRNKIILLTCSKLGIVKVGLVIVVLI